MNVEIIPIAEITPYHQNNRKHGDLQVERIAKSIKDFGFNQPLVLDSDKTVLVGHGRLLAAKQLGMDALPCLIIKGLTEAKKRAYRILDNKLQNDSEWDFEALGLELGFLEEQGFDLEGWGLDDLKALFPEPELESFEDDGPGELLKESYIKTGDLIELGPHRVLCGDSTSVEDVERLLDGKVPILMVTDPPYGVEYDPEWRAGADLGVGKRSKGKVENDDRMDWSEAFQLLPCSVAYVWHAGKFTSEVQESLHLSDFKIVSQIIWTKQHFVLSRGDYHWQHEPCWYAVRNDATHNWQGARDQSTVWDIKNNNSFGNAAKEETHGHGTQKPIECMARPIKNNSKSKDIITDPFLGSGTTLIAADQLNRTCYGMEISPQYCQVILERYQKYCTKAQKPFKCKINGKEFTPPSAL